MKKSKYISLIVLITILLSASSCSNLKYLEKGEVLYTGTKVHVNPDMEKVKKQDDLKDELEDIVRPEPNKKFLGFRFKLWIYNITGGEDSDGFITKWINDKLGEPPVLMRDVDINNNELVMQSYMMSNGFLQSEASGNTDIDGKKGKAIFNAYTGNRYKVNKIDFPNDSTSELYSIILENKENSLLKEGNFYNLERLKNERLRIDNDLKNKGYYYFSPDFIIFDVDSTIGNNKVDIALRIKDDIPAPALKPYVIEEINIYPNYSLLRDSSIKSSEPLEHEIFNIYDPLTTYKTSLFDRLVFFEGGERYNRKDHNLTLNRLVNVGTFKYVKAELVPIDTFYSNKMDVDLYLTSLKNQSLSLDVVGTSKSNDFVGSEAKLSYLHRSIFHGAEQLKLSLAAGFETQYGNEIKDVNSYSLTADARLIFPRFVMPIFDFKFENGYVPKTHITIGAQMLRKSNYYEMRSGRGEFGYLWRGNIYNEHELNPISISYVRTISTTDFFDELLTKVPTLKKNFENQFIIGSKYRFTYNDQFKEYKRNNMYLGISAETAGNLMSLVVPKDDEGRRRLFKTNINQFLRFDIDFRDYFKLNNSSNSILAAKVNIGFGYPYGNSSSLPYVRQFFAGGTNDIRAFRARSVGPGSYTAGNDSILLFADQGGEIKFLTNIELRQKLYSVLYGAIFVDAGNIWLFNSDPYRPGGKFEFKNTLKELAVGSGIGLRVDAQIFVIRFDLGFPIRKPSLPEGNRWIIQSVDPLSKKWRSDNLILNIGIGYPF